ncbi:methyltransferase, ATP-grasp peptide maturase system [Saccharopolyspora kobensis]|uniref:Protein-L-isoaspartate O-methyltransferase n=1 Tax=Saccharopolyspora kobensis TaxID=146035 RepID=A0ABY1E4F5_9PSEU|nr:methyltransferase domain-containing protein [Saccharopolyspora kobensis]SFE67707.1 methyltransferase, ATP-grasp peptide maturase system [Saccharopolyspora kobensis]
MIDWKPKACSLADELAELGKLTMPEWRAAVEATPRHEFVPAYYVHEAGGWRLADTSSPAGRDEWLRRVYSNTVLITALSDGESGQVVRSSSSQPGLMVRMLEALDVHDGQRVLEIGTGTGYNAALLSHRLGAERVFSVDVDEDLVETARARLAAIGHHPTVVTVDGAGGLPGHAPFDRIIATCSVPAVPWSWIEQTQPGGLILTDVKPAVNAGSLVLLRRTDEGAEGRFDRTYAAFMGLRKPGAAYTSIARPRDRSNAVERTTSVAPGTLQNLVVWFLAALDLGAGASSGYTGSDPTQAPTAAWIATADRSWAEIDLQPDGGTYRVREGGPRSLWRAVETAHDTWLRLEQPGWDRFGLTVTRCGQWVWIDDPSSPRRWQIPT